MKKQVNKKIFLIVLIVLSAISVSTGAAIVSAVPDQIILFENQKLNIGRFYTFDIQTETGGIITDGELKNDSTYFADVKFAGFIPVKTVKVSVVEKTKLIPGGESIGIKLYTDGLMVVGVSDFETADGQMASPARNGGIKTGDIIKKVNGQAVNDATALSDIVEKNNGQQVIVDICRNGNDIELKLKPMPDSKNKYKLGMWIRSSVAGIGTMTFYNPQTKTYGALGHGITDSDTNNVVPVGRGEVIPAKITTIKKSEKGIPGELRGSFASETGIGKVSVNNGCGIYGEVTDNSVFSGEAVEIASRDEVTEGKAYIETCINGDEVDKFEIEIQRVSHFKNVETKCMVIKITDPLLLKKAGGILQGMSGSPILQNGKLVGAVTHVFVNDPTRGYGIFIENMLAESEKIR